MLSLTPPHITLCHENEKEIFGETAARCLDLPAASRGVCSRKLCADGRGRALCVGKACAFRGIYSCKGCGYARRERAGGCGEGKIPEIIRAYLARGGDVMTLAPYLYKFTGLSALENGNEVKLGSFNFKNNDESFDAAATALRNIFENI